MARQTQVMLTCDVHDGTAEAIETVAFTVEGHAYECELCEPHLAEFREAMEIWSSHSRAASASSGARRPGRSRRGGDARGVPSTGDVRAWARSEGLDVSGRGRLPAALVAAYKTAH